jgi:hypothetical protein
MRLNVSATRGGPFARESHSPKSESEDIPQRFAVRDCLFLFGISLVAGLSYVNRLGFYADDWYVWARLYGASDHSLSGLLCRLGGTVQKGLGVRPAQVLYQVFAFSTFGLHPLPYHVCNLLVLAAGTVLFYAILRELRLPRSVALILPLVYEFLPHYATDRFWVAAHQAVLSQTFFFGGLYVALRAIRSGRKYSFYLKALSILLFALALLFYEVVLALLPVCFIYIGYRMYMMSREVGGKRSLIRPGLGYALVGAACLGSILLYKVQMTDRVSVPSQYPSSLHIGGYVGKVVNIAIRFNVLHYGVGLPRVALTLYRFSGADVWSVILAVVIAISALLYLHWAFSSSQSALLSRTGALSLIAAGFVVFLIDYLPFIVLRSNFSYDGTSNRVTIAAAIGPACVIAGGTMLLIRACVPSRMQSLVMCSAIAAICALNYVCTVSFADCWAKAYGQQRGIVSEVRKDVNLQPGSTLLLDGFCRYVGPAPVLENGFDAGGALRIAYEDDALQADVVSPTLVISDDAIQTMSYGVEKRYAYGESFWLYNVRRKLIVQLVNMDAARSYFRTINPDKNSGCPVGIEGIGQMY